VQSSKTKDGSGGTGLGLAISRTIMQAHGGRIHPPAGRRLHRDAARRDLKRGGARARLLRNITAAKT
jgi:nitrogen fixation/metabolism regulation signal transduction histidine kinase